MSVLPQALSVGEEQFWQHCMIYHLEPEREYLFCSGRKWRFDFAFIGSKLAVEIEGGSWSGGRHSRGSGFERDCVKYNMATLLGWRVLRFTSGMVLSGEAIDTVRAALKEKPPAEAGG